jgi:hypothetical protein
MIAGIAARAAAARLDGCVSANIHRDRSPTASTAAFPPISAGIAARAAAARLDGCGTGNSTVIADRCGRASNGRSAGVGRLLKLPGDPGDTNISDINPPDPAIPDPLNPPAGAASMRDWTQPAA